MAGLVQLISCCFLAAVSIISANAAQDPPWIIPDREREAPKYMMYLTGQHPIIPSALLVKDITHVGLAFIRSETFRDSTQDAWPLFMTVEEVRKKFPKRTKVLVAIGGWGNSAGFEEAARTQDSRDSWARNVQRMLRATGGDGVDIDWEYPGGNGEGYKRVPNSERAWEIDAYADLLESLRNTIGSGAIISAAVPGLPRDMLAFTPSTIPRIMASVDFLNVMTYDLMNRRDKCTTHHTGIINSLKSINAYLSLGVTPSKMNLGLAFYVKWFKTDPAAREMCKQRPIGCPTEVMEDPSTGADLGKAGAFSWHDEVPPELSNSFSKALNDGQFDEAGGGHYYFDAEEDLFWSWDTEEVVKKKFGSIVDEKGLGGVFAWGLGEDAPQFKHLTAANEGWGKLGDGTAERDEL